MSVIGLDYVLVVIVNMIGRIDDLIKRGELGETLIETIPSQAKDTSLEGLTTTGGV